MTAASSRFWLWRLPAIAATAATILFAAGFAIALRGAAGRPLGQPPPPPSRAPLVRGQAAASVLLVLGDSLARGTGDEAGRGFGGDVLDELKRRGPVDVANLAVNGAESDEVLDLVRREGVRRIASASRWILLSVGGNDLSHAAPRPGAQNASPLESVSRSRARFAANLREILANLREANPNAPIRLLGLYDPFEDADAARAVPARLGASVILNWNDVIQATALGAGDTLVVPTFDLFERRPDRLALDRFHPNRAGYAVIAARVIQTLPPS